MSKEKMKKSKKNKERDLSKTYFIILAVLIIIFLIIFLIPTLSSREISLNNGLKTIFGSDYEIYETKVINSPDNPNITYSFDTILNKKGTSLGKYTLVNFTSLDLKNRDNSIKLIVAFDINGKIKKIFPLTKIKTEKETNWDDFFNGFVGKDFKDLQSNPVPLPAENSELALSLRDKIKEVSSLSYIMDYGVEAFNSINKEQKEFKRLVVGDKIPDFEIIDINGNHISNQTIKGKKTIIVSTNATCGSCIQHTHEFDELINKVKKGKNFNYIFISETGQEKTTNEYLTKTPNKDILKIAIDQSQETLKLLTIDFTPDILFVDVDGTILFHGSPTTQNIENKLTEFLK